MGGGSRQNEERFLAALGMTHGAEGDAAIGSQERFFSAHGGLQVQPAPGVAERPARGGTDLPRKLPLPGTFAQEESPATSLRMTSLPGSCLVEVLGDDSIWREKTLPPQPGTQPAGISLDLRSGAQPRVAMLLPN
jgi:hypothetical protein